ncbi:MAG: M56 family metallopeptidase [Candidatus Aramenus sulfurataquae]|jgi:heat shock protein HtpX|uniref:M56 family metallopeptidase n=2 Tax=Candidatus Aramenus sulfurataquae TaxID=1326980 RepID=A0AAE3FKI7_9CREN|nr:M56 family metallopeptidase [Candidatus Aramenus sulfurataquae]
MHSVLRYWLKYYIVSAVTIAIIDVFVSLIPVNFPFFPIFQVFAIFAVWYLVSPLVMRLTFKMAPSDAGVEGLVSSVAKLFSLKTPKVLIANVDFPNAFAFGNVLWRGMAITRPIFDVLNRSELEAVVAHELSHLKNRDPEILLLTLIAVNSVYVLLVTYFPGLYGLAFALYFFVLFPLFFYVHRVLEKRADLTAVRTSPYFAVPLESSLIKIAVLRGRNLKELSPLQALSMKASIDQGNYFSLFRTHPSLAERLNYLSKYEVYNWTIPY